MVQFQLLTTCQVPNIRQQVSTPYYLQVLQHYIAAHAKTPDSYVPAEPFKGKEAQYRNALCQAHKCRAGSILYSRISPLLLTFRICGIIVFLLVFTFLSVVHLCMRTREPVFLVLFLIALFPRVPSFFLPLGMILFWNTGMPDFLLCCRGGSGVIGYESDKIVRKMCCKKNSSWHIPYQEKKDTRRNQVL